MRDGGFETDRWWYGLSIRRGVWDEPNIPQLNYWNHPRGRVNWYDAVAFCRWLTANTRERPDLLPARLDRSQEWAITLPTEQQWEKAARGHDGRQFPWGEEYQEGRANIDETWSGYEVGPHYLRKTSAVGMYPHKAPNDSPYGVADLSGNLLEWCLNEYGSPERDQEKGSEPRVLRGGSWHYGYRFASASDPGDARPYARDNRLGFRVVLVGFVPVS